MIKLDQLAYKSLKYMMKMKCTSLTLNLRVLFNIPKWKDRKKLLSLVFFLKHWYVKNPTLNATTS